MTQITPAYEKFRKISSNRRQLWVVSYVEKKGGLDIAEAALADLRASIQAGADAIVYINEETSYQDLETALTAARKSHPDFPMGVNYLGDPDEPYGYRGSFELAKKFQLEITWTDFSGVDLIQERKQVNLQDIEKLRPSETFYCSGVQFKYSTLLQPEKNLETSALQAMGWVDGINLSGPKTGIPCPSENAQRVRQAVGDYPIGVASGVSIENVEELLPFVDYYLVASSIQTKEHCLIEDRIRELAHKIHQA